MALNSLAIAIPFGLEHFSWLTAALLFAFLALPVVWLGMRSMRGMSAVRRWVIIAVRLEVILLLVLLLGGLRWQRRAKGVEVYCLRDASDSTSMVIDFPGRSLQRSLDSYFMALAKDNRMKADDTIGVVGFRGIPLVESLADHTLALDGRGTPVSSPGTDIAAAIQLAIASMSSDSMHRIVLATDGNATTGDLDAAVSLAESQHIPIDILPLRYDLHNEIMLDRVVAPSWRREKEPFSLQVYIRSTNDGPVRGSLMVTQETSDGRSPLTDKPMRVTLNPGQNLVPVQVAALGSAGVHRIHAEFTPDPGQGNVDSIAGNNGGDAFTIVRGKGHILYVNNFRDRDGNLDQTLVTALAGERIELRQISVDMFPSDLISLQEYEVVILDNVPRGAEGLSTEQDAMLARYVHDFGGGLVMLGGDRSFGAGGWLGSEVEKVLPVDMEIPAQRQVPKGALVLIMDPGEIPEGAYWGDQCAIKAIDALSERDEIGIIDYGGGAGCEWVFPLQEKGDGSKAIAAIKHMNDGDMPDFTEALQLALNGTAGYKGLSTTDARAKHVIIISDGDNMPASQQTIQQLLSHKISVSTVTAFAEDPSAQQVPQAMQDVATQTHGKAYGPLNNHPNQLPQIFIKEASIVRRTLIEEDAKGIAIRDVDPSDDLLHGISHFPPLFGQVLVGRKSDPLAQTPLTSGKMNDPVFAHWQAGLGKSVVFTSDAHAKWGSLWVGSSDYVKFWAQAVRGVTRAPMSGDFDVETTISGSRGHVRATAMKADGEARNSLSIDGSVVGPDSKETKVRLNQTGPGVYEADFPAQQVGVYVAGLQYQDNEDHKGVLISGVAADNSPEMRDLQSNDAKLEQIRLRTGGRELTPWDSASADVFTHEGLQPVLNSSPVWDLLLAALVGMLLTDVAVRRIAWDWESTKRAIAKVAKQIRDFTNLRQGDSLSTLAALKNVRRTAVRQQADAAATNAALPPMIPKPNAAARFQASKPVQGDITELTAGAKAVVKSPATAAKPGGASGGSMTQSLLEAKRRAQERMRASAEDEGSKGSQ